MSSAKSLENMGCQDTDIVLHFPNFLIQAKQYKENTDRETKYKIKLQRQVGSRYIVTASNGAWAFYLAPIQLNILIDQLSTTKTLNRIC